MLLPDKSDHVQKSDKGSLIIKQIDKRHKVWIDVQIHFQILNVSLS